MLGLPHITSKDVCVEVDDMINGENGNTRKVEYCAKGTIIAYVIEMMHKIQIKKLG